MHIEGRTARMSGRFFCVLALLATAVLLAPGEARAQTPADPRNQCGALVSGAATCSNQAYATGIRYDENDGWPGGVVGPVTLTVTGGMATTVSAPASPPNGWTDGAIVIRTAVQGAGDSTSRAIALTVGSDGNAVAITEHATETNHGILVHQFGNAADAATVTVGSGVTIGTASAPMKHYGVTVLVTESGNTADHGIASAATIHSTGFGLLMDARGSGSTTVTNSGSITTAATGGTAGQQSGIRVLDWSGGFGDDRAAETTTTVTNSGSIAVSAAQAHGIHVDADGLGLYRTVHSGTVSASGAGGHGIYVQASRHAGAAGSEAVAVQSSGVITATGAGGHGILVDASSAPDPGNGNIAVTTTGGTISATGEGALGILAANAGDGAITVTNAAAIEAAADGIHVGKNPANKGAIRIVNTAAIEAKRYGIVVWHGGRSDVRIENSGAIAPASGASPARVGILADQAAAGDIVIVNGADVTGREQGIFARNTEGGTGGGGAVTVTHSAGEVSGGTGEGILAVIGRWRDEDGAESPAPNSTATVRVEVTGGSVKASETHNRVAIAALNHEGGSVEVSVSQGATLTARHNAGIYAQLADRQNTGGRIAITQAGAITAEKGIYATVPRASAAGETRTQPLIDVAWTGTFTQAERAAGSWNNVAHAIEGAQEGQAGAAFRGAAAWAGIDAEVLSWRVLNRIATTGDDPGEIADAAAQAALLDTASTDAAVKARAEAILTRFRAVLTAGGPAIPGADDIDADGDGSYSDAELTAYLSADSDARRVLLRDILARSLSAAEQAVLEAVATGGDVNAALDDASFSAGYKAAVRALLDRYNAGDIRVAMNAGSIASSGDGIRAWYAAPHASNGAIDVTVAGGASVTGGRAGIYAANAGTISVTVAAGTTVSGGEEGIYAANAGGIAVTVAEGASVTGGEAGIYVANAGEGLRIEKKYTSTAIQDANEELGPDDLVTLSDHLDQVVRVQGTVTGGTDAAVHLDGGGGLIVTGAGKLVAGSSGRAVLVNDPGPAVIYIEGEVTGGAGPEDKPAPAAVRLTGGGSVTVGLNGRVRANGADSAIRSDNEPTAVYIEGEATGDEGATAAVHLTGGGSVTVGLNGRVRANGADSAIRRDNEPTAVVFLTDRTVGDLTRGGAREVLARVEGGIVGDGGGDNVTIAEVRDGVTTGHERKNLPVGDDGNVVLDELPPDTFSCDRAMDGRCRLYEALPSVLLSMNGLATRADRLSAAQDGHGGWARVETARGEWKADSSTQPGIAYDHSRHGVRAGVDFPVDESSRLGASVHGLQGSAKMWATAAGQQGEVELSGMGVGVNATTMADDVYLDAQATVTWYEADLTSSTHAAPLKDRVKGLGWALGVEVGHRMPLGGGAFVMPRAGLVWSEVTLDDFTDEVGSGARVSVEDARSMTGRAGLRVEAPVGSGVLLHSSLDAVHEFSEETSTSVSDTLLTSSVASTSVRVGVGGAFVLGENTSLRAAADYTAGGSDIRAWGGSLNLAVRF